MSDIILPHLESSHDLPVGRPDGRPEAYDIMPNDGSTAQCYNCLIRGISFGYRHGEIFQCSPIDSPDGKSYMVCIYCMPDNIVIANPKTGWCRDKSGQNVWHEEG